MGTRGGDEEEGEWQPMKVRPPPVHQAAPPQGAHLRYSRYQAVRIEEGEDMEGVVPPEADL